MVAFLPCQHVTALRFTHGHGAAPARGSGDGGAGRTIATSFFRPATYAVSTPCKHGYVETAAAKCCDFCRMKNSVGGLMANPCKPINNSCLRVGLREAIRHN